MKSKLVALTLSFILSCFLVAGCSPEKKDATTSPSAKQSDKAPAAGKAPAKAAVPEVERVVYTLPQDGSQILVAKKLKVKAAEAQAPLETLKQLVKENSKNLPENTQVLGLTLKKDVAEANFSKELLKRGQGEYTQTMFVYAVVNTLTEFPGIKKIQFLVDGKKVEVWGQMDLAEPLERNSSYLRK